MDEINKFERLGHATEGCHTGQHIIDETEGHSTVEKDGNNTRLKMRCLVCRQQIDFSAPFGLNDYIKGTSEPVQQIQPSVRPTEPIREEYVQQSDVLKRILG